MSGDLQNPQQAIEHQQDRFLTSRQVAQWLNVSEAWVRDHSTRKQPRLPVMRIGGVVRFRESDLRLFIEKYASAH
jgi:predicted DNA-binding transcriptional regulator AlpA